MSSTHIASATNAASKSRTDGSTATGEAKSTGSGGLSSGAEAGIGAGVGIGVGLALLAGGGFFFWRRRQKRNKDVLQQQQQQYRQSGVPPHQSYGGPPLMAYNQYRDDYSSTANESYRPWPSPSDPSSQSHSVYAYELQPNDLRSPVEAPSTRWQEPPELQTHAEHYSKSTSPPPSSIQPSDGRNAR